MNTSLSNLHVFVAQSMAPSALNAAGTNLSELERLRNMMLQEADRIRQKMIWVLFDPGLNLDKRRWLGMAQRHLVQQSDVLNRYLHREHKLWCGHGQAQGIRQTYLYCIDCLEVLLRFIRSSFPEYWDGGLKMTDSASAVELPRLRAIVNHLEARLKGQEVGTELRTLLIWGLRRQLHASRLSETGVAYIERLAAAIALERDLDEAALAELLIRYNFNCPEFFLYQSRRLKADLLEADGIHEQLELLMGREEEIGELGETAGLSLDLSQPAMRTELLAFCELKYQSLERLIEARKLALKDQQEIEGCFRILSGFSVPQLALFLRAQMEAGVLMKVRVRELSIFVSRYFYTEKAAFISVDSLTKRATDVEFSSAVRVGEMLKAMMDWLDKRYQIRAFS